LNHTDDAFDPVAPPRDVVVCRAGLRMHLLGRKCMRAAPKGAFDRAIADHFGVKPW
jgi:hypothetical protein